MCIAQYFKENGCGQECLMIHCLDIRYKLTCLSIDYINNKHEIRWTTIYFTIERNTALTLLKQLKSWGFKSIFESIGVIFWVSISTNCVHLISLIL